MTPGPRCPWCLIRSDSLPAMLKLTYLPAALSSVRATPSPVPARSVSPYCGPAGHLRSTMETQSLGVSSPAKSLYLCSTANKAGRGEGQPVEEVWTEAWGP